MTVCAFVQMCIYFCISLRQSPAELGFPSWFILWSAPLGTPVLHMTVRSASHPYSSPQSQEVSPSFGLCCSNLQLQCETEPWLFPGRVLAGSSWQLGSCRIGKKLFQLWLAVPAAVRSIMLQPGFQWAMVSKQSPVKKKKPKGFERFWVLLKISAQVTCQVGIL